jgi:biotin operon repressor
MKTMDVAMQRDLLNMLKVVADDHRLTIIGLLSEREYTVTELAARLKLSEPTVSHHVKKLHSVGLVSLKVAANRRLIRPNQARLGKLKTYMGEIDTPPVQREAGETPDEAWIDALDWEEDDKKVLRDYTLDGRLTQIPVKNKKWLVIVRWLATKFTPGERYTEKQVNAILAEVHEDYASPRRALIEYGYMRREADGSAYWRIANS